MAIQKYCDHGLYGAAVFDGYISGTTLTVTNVVSGVVSPGMWISSFAGGGANAGPLLNATYITAGTGPAYTVSVGSGTQSPIGSAGTPARFTGQVGLPLAAPVFGSTQDGDGLAQGTATCATTSIDLANYTAAAGNTFAVAGAMLTCVASGAAANQFNAGSGAALATALASAINAATNAVNTPVKAGVTYSTWFRPQLRNAAYAVAVGAVLQIQTRAGSALYNANDTAGWVVTSNGFAFTGPATGQVANVQFSGGVSGAWGWLLNCHSSLNMWPGALGNSAYGVLGSNSPRLMAGSLDAKDNVNERAGKFIVSQTNVYFVGNLGIGSATNGPVTIQIDDGTIWPDGQYPVFKIAISNTNGTNSINFTTVGGCSVVMKGKLYGNGNRSWVLEVFGSFGGGPIMSIAVGSVMNVRYEGMDFIALYTIPTYSPQYNLTNPNPGVISGNPAGFITQSNGSAFYGSVVKDCRFMGTSASNYSAQSFINHSANGPAIAKFENTEISVAYSNAALTTGVINVFSGATGYRLDMEGCKFTGFQAGSQLCKPSDSLNTGSNIVLRNIDYGNVTQRGPYIAYNSTSGLTSVISTDGIYSISKLGSREFSMDTRFGYCAWNATLGFPVLSGGAKLLDGVTPWSMAFYPATNVSFGSASPWDLPTLNRTNTLDTADRTVSVEFLLDSRLAWDRSNFSMLASWTDASGKLAGMIDTYTADGSGFAASLASWALLNGDASNPASQVAYNLQTYNRYRMTFTIPALPLGSELTITPRLHNSVAIQGMGGFIDYEMSIA